MENVILAIVLAVILGLAVWYIIRARKKGQKCIGCPGGCTCGGENGCKDCRGCSSEEH